MGLAGRCSCAATVWAATGCSPRRRRCCTTLRGDSLWCDDHSAVFPRSRACRRRRSPTGCLPARHGLHGNRMGLIEGGRIVVRDVGAPDFRDAHAPRHRRHAAGAVAGRARRRTRAASSPFPTSRRAPPTSSIPSISATSITAAGTLRAGRPAARARCLDVSHDAAGDWAMTERFCREVLGERKPAVAFMWLCDPDHTLHGVPLGSPAHAEALAAPSAACRGRAHRRAAARRGRGDPAAGRLRPRPGDDRRRRRSRGLAGRARPGGRSSRPATWRWRGRARRRCSTPPSAAAPGCWASSTRCAASRGPPTSWSARPGRRAALRREGGVVAAVNMARQAKPIPTAFPAGAGWLPRRQAGADRQRPAWRLGTGRDAAVPDGQRRRSSPERGSEPTSLVDIAPTLSPFSGFPTEGFDGSPLPLEAILAGKNA